MIELLKFSFSQAETPFHYLMAILAPIITLIIFISFIQLFYNVGTGKDPYSQSPHWLGNMFRLFIKIVMIIVKLLSYVMIAVVWIYYKTKILLYLIWAKITGKKPDVMSVTPPPYNPLKN